MRKPDGQMVFLGSVILAGLGVSRPGFGRSYWHTEAGQLLTSGASRATIGGSFVMLEPPC